MRSSLLLLLLAACWTSPSSSPAPTSPPVESAQEPLHNRAPLAEAEPPPGHSVWRGKYRCTQGVTAVQLTLDRGAAGGVEAIFDFGPHAGNPNLPAGSYRLTGALDERGTHLELRLAPEKWILQPPGYEMVAFEASTTDPSRRRMRGTIDNVACGEIELVRVD